MLAVLPHALVAACVVLVGLPMLNFPLGPDQAIFATVGKVVWEGGFPYTDAWDQKPPSIYFIYAFAIHGPLGVMKMVRVFDLLWLAATVAALVELGRRWWSLRAGVSAGLCYGLIYVTTSAYWHSAQPDGFIGLPLALALLLYDRARGRFGWLVCAGVLLGFAFQLRFISALLIPFFPLVELAAVPRGRKLRTWLRRMLALGAGFAAFQAAVLAYLTLGGALGEYIAATRWAGAYTKLGGPYSPEGLTWSNYWPAVRFSFLFWMLGRLLLTAPAVAGALVGVFIVKERRVQQVVLFVALAYLGIAAQAKFFTYHYFYLLLPAALLAGWAWDRCFGALRRSLATGAARAASAVIVALLALSTPEVLDVAIAQWRSNIAYYRDPDDRESFFDYFGPWNGGSFSYLASAATADYIAVRTRPEDTIYVWGYDPLVYLLAQREPASRFIYSFPLMTNWSPPHWKAEFIADLERRAPLYFLVQRYEGARWITGLTVDSGEYIAWFPALERVLAEDYTLEAEIEDFLIYRRVAGSG